MKKSLWLTQPKGVGHDEKSVGLNDIPKEWKMKDVANGGYWHRRIINHTCSGSTRKQLAIQNKFTDLF